MLFMVEVSAQKVKEGGVLESVQCLQLDTNSFCPRSNRRKIRAFLVRYCGVKPNKVKAAMKKLDWQTPPRRTRSVLKEWVRKQGDVAEKDLNRATMMIKHSPGSMLGIIDGVERRATQKLYEAERKAELEMAAKREAELDADMELHSKLDDKNSWGLKDVTTKQDGTDTEH